MKPAQSGGLLDRTVQQRDARLFVLSLEGEETGAEYTYFAALETQRIVERQRIKLLLLPADPVRHDSTPADVLERLDQHCRRYKMRERYDQHWLVCDVDTWPDKSLAAVSQEALSRGYRLAVSNPCFELWLLLHETDDLAFLAEHEPRKRSGATKRRLGAIRTQSATSITVDKVWLAKERARALDPGTGERWPGGHGSHVYRLIEALADAGALRGRT